MILQYITIVSALLMILLILIQQRGASLGAGFGASGELYTKRRGLEKTLFDVTVVLAVVFVISIVAAILFPNF